MRGDGCYSQRATCRACKQVQAVCRQVQAECRQCAIRVQVKCKQVQAKCRQSASLHTLRKSLIINSESTKSARCKHFSQKQIGWELYPTQALMGATRLASGKRKNGNTNSTKIIAAAFPEAGRLAPIRGSVWCLHLLSN